MKQHLTRITGNCVGSKEYVSLSQTGSVSAFLVVKYTAEDQRAISQGENQRRMAHRVATANPRLRKTTIRT